MQFDDVLFPTGISLGAVGGPSRRTTVVELAGGAEERNARWADSRRSFDVSYGIRKNTEVQEVVAFFEARNGRLRSFRFRDWSDYRSGISGSDPDPLDVALGTGDAAETEFQLVKAYASGAQSYLRRITKPVAGSVRVAVDGSEMLSGWSVDLLTGVVTFDAPVADGEVVSAGFEFDVPVRFDTDDLVATLRFERLSSISSIPLIEVRE